MKDDCKHAGNHMRKETKQEVSKVFDEKSLQNGSETENIDDQGISLRFDPFRKYLAEMRRYPVLTRKEENEISKQVYDEHDMTAAQKLAVSNLRLVVKIASEYYNVYLNILDLIQEGNVGLLHAVKKYNPYKGTKFSTYASFWIRAYILKHIMDSWSLVKVGTTQGQRKLFYRLNREKQRLESLGIYPTPQLLANNFGLKEKEVEDMEKRLSCNDITLDVPVHDGSDETLMDRMSSDQDVEEIVSERHKSAVLSRMMNEFKATLDERDRYIFDNRVVADEPMSLREIGDIRQISRERVRQVEARIVKRFKIHFQESLEDLGLQNLVTAPKAARSAQRAAV
ncbi:MAG TPA: sigma-70 family RNA polymerase sigma factor [Syntrophorhabdaceae bacterium]|nr:sigma-70 family RNA polymerase sigma factor [Syntrophorhabdaceae bacterium]